MKKFLLVLTTISLTAPVVLAPVNVNDINNKINENDNISQNNINNIETQAIGNDEIYLNDIKTKSTKVSENKVLVYNNKKFKNKQELEEYLLKNNSIEKITTSSDLNKVDYKKPSNPNDQSFLELNDKQIYGTNPNDFDFVYKTAQGKVVKTKQEALESYTKLNNVVSGYSYNDLDDWSGIWFNTPDEAQTNLRNNFDLYQSPYYYLDGQYFNALSVEDNEDLLKKIDDFYTFKIDKTLFGQPLQELGVDPIIISGNKTDINDGSFKEYIKETLYPLWINDKYGNSSTKFGKSFLANVLKLQKKWTMEINFDSKWKIGIRTSVDDYNTFGNDEPISIEFDHNYYEWDNSNQAREWFLKPSNWTKKSYSWFPGIGSSYEYWIGNFKNVKIWKKSGNRTTYIGGDDVEITLFKGDVKTFESEKAPDINNDYIYSFTSKNNWKLFLDKEQTLKTNNTLEGFVNFVLNQVDPEKLNDVNELSQYQKQHIYNSWFNLYYENILSKIFLNLKNEKSLTFQDLKDNKINVFNNNKIPYNHLIPGKFIIDKSTEKFGDWAILKSILNFYNNWFAKKEELAFYTEEEIGDKLIIKKMYDLFGNESITVDEDEIKNFLPLDKTVPLKKMWHYSQKRTNDISNQPNLYYSKEAALKERDSKLKNALVKRYKAISDDQKTFAYSNISAEDAIKKLHLKINVVSKRIHRDEIKNLFSLKNPQWSQIISDINKKSEIYKLVNPKTKKASYFKDYQNALQFLMSNFVQEKTDEIYYYEHNFYKLDRTYTFKINFYNKQYNAVLGKLKEYINTNWLEWYW